MATAKKAKKKSVKKAKVTKMTQSSSTGNSAKKAKAKVSPLVKQPKAKKTSNISSAQNFGGLIHGIEPYEEKSGEEYMSDAQVKHFSNILNAWKAELVDDVSRTMHLMQDENINHPDPNDRASQETDISLELRNRDRDRKLLKKINSTLARLDSDEYGWCERCGIEIGIRRLEARPTADLCVDCKTLNEIKEKQMI